MLLYYPRDDTIRNKRCLTLIVPEYIVHISTLFKTIGDSIIKDNKEMNITIPTKEGVVREILKELNNICSNTVGDLCNISQTRVKHASLIV